MRCHRHHGVQLEVASLSGQRDGGVVPHHLGHHLHHRLGNHGVDLARHYRTARLHLRQGDFAQAGAGAGGDKTDVVGYFVQADGNGLQLTAGLDQGIQRGLSLEVIARFADFYPGCLGHEGAGAGGKLRVRVDAGADGGASQGHFGQCLLRPLHPLDAVAGLSGVAQELLPQPHRGGVLQVGAAGLDDGPEFLGLALQFGRQCFKSGNQVFLDGEQRSQVNGRGDDVVGRLAHVDMVVGMDQPGAEVAAQELAGPVGDDLVGVGISRCAGAGLENVQHEVTVELSINDFLSRGDDGVARALFQQTQGHVAAGGGLLDEAQGADEGAREAQVADGEVQHGAHG